MPSGFNKLFLQNLLNWSWCHLTVAWWQCWNLLCQAWKSWRLHKFVMIYNQRLSMVNWTFQILSQSILTQKEPYKTNMNKFTICFSGIDIVLLINHVSYYFLFSSVRLRNWVGPLQQLKEAASNKVTGIVVLLRQRQPKWLSIITASKFFWFGIHSKQQDTYCCS